MDMKMQFGKYKHHEISSIPLSYLDWVHSEYSPMVEEIRHILKIRPIWQRLFERDVREVLERFGKAYPNNHQVLELIDEIKQFV
jgi:hypothetical protein